MPRDARRRWRRPVLAGAAVLALVAGWGAGRVFDRGPGEADAARTAAGPGPGTAASEEPPNVLHRPRPEFTPSRSRRADAAAGGVERQGSRRQLLGNLVRPLPERDPAPHRSRTAPARGAGHRHRGGPDPKRCAHSPRRSASDYPILLDDLQGSTMRRYGNRVGALPFTVITGRDGVVAYVRLGGLEPTELDRITAALLRREPPSQA